MATPFRLKRSAISGKRPEIGDLQLGELALNFNDGYLFARRDTGGVGIADTVSLLNPWTENFGAGSIFYEQSVGIGTTSPTEKLTVFGSAYVSENFNTKTLFSSTITSNNGIFTSFSVLGISTFSDSVDINAALDVDGHTELDELQVTGISTFTADLDINAAIDVDGHTELDELQVTGVSTFTADLDINAAIDVDGHTELDELNVSGVSTFAGLADFNGGVDISGHVEIDNISISGVTTFTDTTNNTLGDADTGAVQIDGGLGVNKNATIGGSLNIGQNLNVTGVSTFSSDLDINAAIDVDGHTELDELNVAGVATFVSAIDANGGLDVFGQTELDDLNVSGVATITSLNVQTNFDVFDSVATFHNDVFVAGNLSIGGTTTVIQAQDLKVFDRDIILGVTTDSNNNDISTDITANHGGIAIASTEGSPLVDLSLLGFSDLPSTYKQLMWVSANSYGVGTTDAWHFNYAVGIGSTQVPNDVRLAVSEIQFTDDTIDTPQLFSGISTFTGTTEVRDSSFKVTNTSASGQYLEITQNGDSSLNLNKEGTGSFFIRGNNIFLQNNSTSETYAGFWANGKVNLNFDGSTRLETTGYGVTVVGGLEVSGIATYKDTTDNTLGDADTGAVRIDGGLGVNKNVTVGGNLNVQGYSELVGVVTFRGGTINIGDADTDDVNVGGEFISSLIPNDDATYTLGSSSKRWRDGIFSGIVTTNNLYASGITTTVLFNVGVGGTVITTTETGLVGINSTAPTVTLDVGGTINSSTDVTINGTSVLTTATNDAVALAIALG